MLDWIKGRLMKLPFETPLANKSWPPFRILRSEATRKNLVEFHKTISEQLDSRLSESPRFLGAVVIALTAYGFALELSTRGLLLLATGVLYAVLLWAIWYLIVLSYAFRHLQNIQHGIENRLGWSQFRPLKTGIPPGRLRHYKINELFWIVPGIYQPHLAGLLFLIGVLSFVTNYLYGKELEWLDVGLMHVPFMIALLWAGGLSRHYFIKYREKRV